jgi:hypothetical protein
MGLCTLHTRRRLAIAIPLWRAIIVISKTEVGGCCWFELGHLPTRSLAPFLCTISTPLSAALFIPGRLGFKLPPASVTRTVVAPYSSFTIAPEQEGTCLQVDADSSHSLDRSEELPALCATQDG